MGAPSQTALTKIEINTVNATDEHVLPRESVGAVAGAQRAARVFLRGVIPTEVLR